MSTRVLTGEATHPAEQHHWTPVPKCAGPSSYHAPAQSGDPPAEEGQIARIEAEYAIRIEEARRAARREGEAAGETRVRAELATAVDQFVQAAVEMASLRPSLRKEAERDVVHLALAVARKILHRELSVDPRAILGIIKAAMEQIDAAEVCRLRAHPADANLIQGSLDALSLPAGVEVLADTSLNRGAVVFDLTRGSLDASVDTQLQEIERGFADLLHRL